jgi:ATP-binding protein involved in chromosome partitioning
MRLDPRADGARARVADIGRIIAVTGGKGGIGKSTVASTLALVAASEGRRVGLLDLDLTSPSAHVLLGFPVAFPEEPFGVEPSTHAGIRCMSIAHFAGSHATPLRGGAVSNAILEVLAITNWGELDLLVIDMPPGLGDTTLDITTLLGRTEHLIVTTPSRVVEHGVDRMLQLLTRVGAPIVGVLENMNRETSERASDLATKYGVPYVGSLPFDATLEDAVGSCERLKKTAFARALARCARILNL